MSTTTFVIATYENGSLTLASRFVFSTRDEADRFAGAIEGNPIVVSGDFLHLREPVLKRVITMPSLPAQRTATPVAVSLSASSNPETKITLPEMTKVTESAPPSIPGAGRKLIAPLVRRATLEAFTVPPLPPLPPRSEAPPMIFTRSAPTVYSMSGEDIIQ